MPRPGRLSKVPNFGHLSSAFATPSHGIPLKPLGWRQPATRYDRCPWEPQSSPSLAATGGRRIEDVHFE